MNIFYLSRSIINACIYHCDKHVVKMILETTQLLYTCLHLTMTNTEWLDKAPKNKSGQRGYKKCHDNHPCSKWTRESLDNYKWLCEFGLQLCKEYSYRYENTHSCQEHLEFLATIEPPIESKGKTKMPQAMPDEYKRDDAVEAYRAYYRGAKKKFCKWTKRDMPEWFKTDE